MAGMSGKKSGLVAKRRNQRDLRRVLAPLAFLVAIVISTAFMLPAISMTHGDLVCGMEEHSHTKACYEQVLVCGMEEGEGAQPATDDEPAVDGHKHTKACYEKQLTCDVSEHKHNDACYAEAEPEPVKPVDEDVTSSEGVGDESASQDATDNGEDAGQSANQDTYAESQATDNQYEDANLQEDESIDSESEGMPAQTFEATLKDADGKDVVIVNVKAPKGALPENVMMKIDGVDAKKVWEPVQNAVARGAAEDVATQKAMARAGATDDIALMTVVDVVFLDEAGNVVEPSKKLEVKITSDMVRDMPHPAHPFLARVTGNRDARDDTKRYADAELIVKKVKVVNQDEKDLTEGAEDTLKFKADKFGPYAIMQLADVDEAKAGQGAELSDAADSGKTANSDGKGSPEVAEVQGPAVNFEREVSDAEGNVVLKVAVDVPENTLPEGADMHVSLVENEDVINAATEAAADEAKIDANRAEALAADITFVDAEGNAIEPAGDVRVAMTAPAVAEQDQLAVVHVDDETNAQVVQGEDVNKRTQTVAFDAVDFSVYALVYTVDFHWEVDGKSYQFSIPGGGFVTLQQLVEVLGIAKTDSYDENASDQVGNGGGSSEEDNGTNSGDASGIGSRSAYIDIPVSEKTRAFVADVEKTEFSSPSYAWVGKVSENATVGELKEASRLKCQYSAELAEEQIADINAQSVEAGDWALISMLPFQSEESLVVTMKTGESFTIRVTDAQISANVLTADGITFKITVTFDEDAQIPNGTTLEANEIEYGTEEYLRYLGKTWSEVNKAYAATKSSKKDNDVRSINVNMARFFDIKLLYHGKEIEPKAPVQVEITYTDGLLSTDKTRPGVVHFKRADEAEILEEVETEVDGDVAVGFRYELESFSVMGTYIQMETHDVETPPHVSEFTPARAATSVQNISFDDAGAGGEEKHVEDTALKIAPTGLRADGETESSAEEDDSDLPQPESHKSLEPNDDGTYTLTLSVKGRSRSVMQQRQKKANVLFVMDRSSSMITNTVSDEEKFWYYGTWNASETTFRADIRPDTGYQFYGLIDGQYVELNVSSTWSQWYGYNLTYWNGQANVNYPTDYPIYVRSKTTRLYAEQEALNDVINNLLAYNTDATPDTVEIALISFAYRRGNLNSWASETEHAGWVTGIGENDDLRGLLNAVDSTRYASGTNWEEALQYAYEVISAKEQAEASKPEEDYYVIFLTDGEPTNTARAALDNESAGNMDNMYSYNAARDEARNLAKYHFYNIFTYRNPDKENDIYSVYLTNYAYNQGTDPNDDRENDYVKEYYSDARTIDALKDKLSNIIQTIADVIGHANVSITDTLTTDAMTTTIVQGKTNGYVYTVKDPNETVLFTVTATGDINNPTVTFNVPDSATKTYTATPTDVDGKKLYSVTTAEGVEYRIALADVDNTTGELTWDLSPVGILMNDCTYSVSFTVWPDQDAYDYVAALNNGLKKITDSRGEEINVAWVDDPTQNPEYEDLTATKGYAKGGVAQYPSIVKYPDGTFAVLTNTDQKVHYSVVEMETVNGEPNGDPTVHGPYYQDLETPDPMELTASETKLQKAWGIDRNPSTLAQLLYNDDGTPTQFKIEYGIKILDQGEMGAGSEGSGAGQGNPDDEQDEPSYYTTLTLGWDGTKYDWDPSSVRYVSLNGNSGPSVPVGTSWSKDFAIATGLMLSEARMDALGLDKEKYGPPYSYGSTNYYILETGHDYTIEEIIPEDAPRDAYEFDFDAPTYHPMLVDGKLKSVTFNRNEANNEIISIKEISKNDWLLSLKIENNLRGYIRLEKDIVDKDGRTPLPEDDTEFEYEIDIEDPLSPGRFTGTHIPWYGVDGLFYHSIDNEGKYHYFQAETNAPPNNAAHVFMLTTESGEVCQAVCIDPATGEMFDEDDAGPTLIQYVENGETKRISLYGNQMECRDENHVHAVMKINQNQVLDIANVPSKSTYTIKEVNQEGYDLVNIRREIRNNNNVESGNTYTGNSTITGIIVPDRDNHVIYTNKPHSVDLTVKKIDENEMPLTGAVFSLYKKDGGNWPDEPYATKPGDEEDTATYEFINLPDGNYKLVETPPTGYAAVGDVFFTVSGGELSIDGALPAGVTKDENQLLLTVKDTPRNDSLTVRKQWLDYNGNPRDYDGTLDLKLVQWVQNTANNHDITVYFRYTGDNGSPFVTKAGHGSGPATIQWQWNSNTTNPDVNQITVTGLNSGEYTVTKGNNYWFTLAINNVNRDINVTINVANYGYNPYHYDGTAITDVSIAEETITEEYSATGGTKTITLGDNGIWTNTLTVSGDGLLSDDSTTLPATYNGKNCYYSIAEESVPEGFELIQISTDKVQSGVLTAYNKRTTEDVDITVRKVWEDGLNEDGTTTSHQDHLVVTLSNGQSVTLNEDNHWEATITGLPKTDEEGNEIAYSWTEDELENGYYLSDSNTVIYDNNVTTTLTNSYSDHYMPEMEIDGVKIWDDGGTGNRPSSITVNLYKDDELYRTTTVNPPTGEGADPDRWTFKFTNLPIFNTDANGNATGSLAVYTVKEVLPEGYTSDYETTIQAVQATYEAGTAEAHIINSYTAENQLVCEGADLGFVVVRHGQGYVVWTPRPLRDGELDKIKQAAVNESRQFSGIMSASGDKLTIISGVPKTVKVGNKEAATVYMKDGDVWVRFEDPSAESDIVYGSIPYTYMQIGGEGGVTITNVRMTTSISGTKTWVDGRQHNNSEEITLKLYRTNKPVTENSEWEEVQLTATGAESLSWDGNTYTYSGLPRYSDYASNPPIEYEYRVEETAVNVTEGMGAGQHSISYMMENDGNNFINTELTNIEATKTWKDAGVLVNSTLTNASVTFELQKKVGDNWIKVEQEGVTNPQTLSVAETPHANAWKATWSSLPKYEKSGENIVAIEYRVVETAASLDGQNVKPDTDPAATVSLAGKANIDNILQITINILKVDANDNTIKLGNAEFELIKVQSLETTNQVTEGQYSKTGTTSDANDDTKGTLQFTGITPGYYYLHETKAPDGYVLATTDGWHFQVNESGIVEDVGDFITGGTFQYVDAKNVIVENTPGAALPNTGGTGTNLYYFFGCILTMLAGAVMVMKKRRQSKTA